MELYFEGLLLGGLTGMLLWGIFVYLVRKNESKKQEREKLNGKVLAEEKECANCKHSSLRYWENPCSGCSRFSQWDRII